MKDPNDRSVHARTADGGQLVRYDRAGKWFVEYPGDPTKKRRGITVKQAVRLAVEAELLKPGSVRQRMPGGLMFEAAFRRELAAVRK